MKTVRQRIWEFVRSHRAVTAIEISQALQMTEANARRHLGILRSQGLAEVIGQRPASGKGRPSLVYSISEAVLGNNLDQLASALLSELALSTTSGEARDRALDRLAQQMGLGASSQNNPQKNPIGSGHLTQRLNTAIQRLNEMHYQARWEAHREAPRVIFGHCPYIAVLPSHPELCLLDNKMLQYLSGSPVKQTARLARDAQGIPHCIFSLTGGVSG